MSRLQALHDQISSDRALGFSLRALAPANRSPALLEQARPYLTPFPTWWHCISAPVDAAHWKAASIALWMLYGPYPNACSHWLEYYGADPLSRAATDAWERGRDWLSYTSMGQTDYVRAMLGYDLTGGYEYLLACTFADPIDTRTPKPDEPKPVHERHASAVARCERLTGRSPRQLWADYHTAWACRPSLHRWGACKNG